MPVRVSAPGKLVLFGDHAAVYGYPCIVTAVDLRYSVQIDTTEGGGILIDTDALRSRGDRYEIDVDQLSAHNRPETAFVEAALARLLPQVTLSGGLYVRTDGPPHSYGLGSSSAITAATIAALADLCNLQLSLQQIFDLAYSAVLDVQGSGSGVDLAAAIYGGTVYYVKGNTISPLQIDTLPVVIGYSGKKVGTTSLLAEVAALRSRHSQIIDSLFALMGEISTQARDHMLAGRWAEVGDLCNVQQGLLDSLGVSTAALNRLILAAREAGADGAKLSGAGGGDCMFALTPQSEAESVTKAIESAGGSALHFASHAEGLRVESSSMPS